MKKPQTRNRKHTIHLLPRTDDKLLKLCKKYGVSFNNLIEQIVEDSLT